MENLRRFFRILLGLARELADESGYARYLAHHRSEHSPEQWRRFTEERLRSKYTRPKCC